MTPPSRKPPAHRPPDNNKRILVLYAGGTVGMVRKGQGGDDGGSDAAGGYAPGHALPQALRQLIQNHAVLRLHDWHIQTLEPLLDSANARPEHWYALAARLWRCQRDCDAAVILHGTDTMDYACAFLAFLMQGWQRPILFTGAQHPLGIAASDAEQNVLDALLCAVSEPPPSEPVVLCMGGCMLSGVRVVKMGLDVATGFQTPHWPVRAQRQADAGEQCADQAATPPNPTGQTILVALQTGSQTGQAARVGAGAGASVGVLRLYPAMPPELLVWMGGRHPDGLILQTYGSGTGATDASAFCAALAHVCQQGVPVVAVSQCPHAAVDLTTYEAGLGLQQAGVLSGGNMTTAAAFAKLHSLAGLRKLGIAPVENVDVQRWMLTPLVGEVG